MNLADGDELVAFVKRTLPAEFTGGRFKVGLVQNHYSILNDEYFIKIAGPGASPSSLERELRSTILLIDSGCNATTQPASLEVFSSSGIQITVWHRNFGSTYTPDLMSPQRTVSALTSLRKVHRARVSVDATMDQTAETVRHRMALRSWMVADRTLKSDISLLVKAFVSPANHSPNPGGLVLCHGDAHAGNLLYSHDDVATLCDIESARMASPEWDIACLRHNVLRIGGRKDSWDVIAPLLTEYDHSLVDYYEATKATTGITHLIASGEYALARARTDAMLPVLDGGDFPDRLQCQPGR